MQGVTLQVQRWEKHYQLRVAGSMERDPMSVRPGTAGLLIGIESSRVRDSSWMYLTSLVTTRIGVELAAVQRKLPDCVVVGLQLYPLQTIINT